MNQLYQEIVTAIETIIITAIVAIAIVKIVRILKTNHDGKQR